VFKVGDAVTFANEKAAPPKRLLIEALGEGGLKAKLSDGRLVHVAEIRPWAPTAVGGK
jgi:hypothetical protein